MATSTIEMHKNPITSTQSVQHAVNPRDSISEIEQEPHEILQPAHAHFPYTLQPSSQAHNMPVPANQSSILQVQQLVDSSDTTQTTTEDLHPFRTLDNPPTPIETQQQGNSPYVDPQSVHEGYAFRHPDFTNPSSSMIQIQQPHNTPPTASSAPMHGYYASPHPDPQPPIIPSASSAQMHGYYASLHPDAQSPTIPPPSYQYSNYNNDNNQQPQPAMDMMQQPFPIMSRPLPVTRLSRLGENPEYIDCPFCEKRTQTKVEHPSSDSTSLAALFCCLCCGIIGVCVPYLCGWFADTDHTCSECKMRVTHRPHDGTVQVQPVRSVGGAGAGRQEPSRYAVVEMREGVDGGADGGNGDFGRHNEPRGARQENEMGDLERALGGGGGEGGAPPVRMALDGSRYQ